MLTTSLAESERWGLLLVHYTKTERDFVVELLRSLWHYGFVNAVAEVEAGGV